MKTEKKVDPPLPVYLSTEERGIFRVIAARRGLSMSKLACEAIRKMIREDTEQGGGS